MQFAWDHLPLSRTPKTQLHAFASPSWCIREPEGLLLSSALLTIGSFNLGIKPCFAAVVVLSVSFV